MNIAIIPARENSKRIKNKNIKKFFGKPIIAYSIETIKKTGIFDKIIVSTDSKKISKISKNYGAEVPFLRPKFLSGDRVGSNDVISHVVKKYGFEKVDNCFVCCIYPTTPMLTPQIVVKGLKQLKKTKSDFCIAVTEFEAPVERRLYFGKHKKKNQIFLKEKVFDRRSQDMEKFYYDAGQFYWGKPSSFINFNDIFKSSVSAIKLNKLRFTDINTIDNWKRSEIKFKLNN